MDQKETTKPPVERILARFFARLRETGGLDEQAVLRLEQLSKTGKLANLESLKAALAPPSMDQS